MQQFKRQLQRKIRILKSELKMLQNYYDESHNLFKEYEQEWLSDLNHFQKKFKGPQPVDETPDATATGVGYKLGQAEERKNHDTAEQPEKFHPEWAKKLFRKIAMLTHPDRAMPEDKARLEALFLKASTALESEDHEELLSLALDLGISIDIDAPELRPLLEKRVAQVKEKIASLECDIPWIWGEGFGLLEIRIPLLRAVLANDGIDTNDEELRAEISKRESKNDTG